MAEELYALNLADVQTLRELVAAYRRGDLGRPQERGNAVPLVRGDVVFGIADAAISAAATTPVSGTLNVYKMSSTGGVSDSGRNETVYNLSSVSRTTDEYTVGVRDYYSGKYLAFGSGSGAGYKKLCRFVLDAALSTTAASVAGKITNQYGDGTAHSTTGTITLGNLLTKTAGTYTFEGSSGNAGLAYHTSGTAWRIVQMQCTTS